MSVQSLALLPPHSAYHHRHQILIPSPLGEPLIAHCAMAVADDISPVARVVVRAPSAELRGAATALGVGSQSGAPDDHAVFIAPAASTLPPVRSASPARLSSAAGGASDSGSDDGAVDGDIGYGCTVFSYRPRYEKERGHNNQSCSAVNRDCTCSPAAPAEFKTESCSCSGKTAKQKCTAKSL